jgi:hypothetical protein
MDAIYIASVERAERCEIVLGRLDERGLISWRGVPWAAGAGSVVL